MVRLINFTFLTAFMMISTGCLLKFDLSHGHTQNTPPVDSAGPSRQVLSTSVAPMKFRSLVESWIRQANLTNPTAITSIFTTYNLQKNQLPQNGLSSEINSSSLQSIFIVAAQVCGALKDQEKALANGSRLIFNDFNFAATPTQTSRALLVSDAAVSNAFEALSQSFLGRSASDEEKLASKIAAAQIFLNVTITSANNRTLVNDTALILCTSVLSSLEAISI